MGTPSSFDGEAFNPVPDSPNRIHSDEVAQAFGFEGALVPGVTVSAYLLEPAVVAWGRDFLERGEAHVTVERPVYDGRAFHVEVEPGPGDRYSATLLVAGEPRARATARLPADRVDPPRRAFDAAARPTKAPATREGLEALRARGVGSARFRFGPDDPMARTYADPERMPPLLRPGAAALANASYVLGMTNWLFAANVDLGPWVHLETWSRHFAAIPSGAEVVAEGRVVDLFERRGHEFVDLDVAMFLGEDLPAATVRMRAIYRLRAPARAAPPQGPTR
ncbi:MAG: hypothetical protein FJ104_01570 [Deltaproteobacteria bacterium]|nr:hypothetical protein [Deltaproteobacteria bacterium]